LINDKLLGSVILQEMAALVLEGLIQLKQSIPIGFNEQHTVGISRASPA
jgi:hypothetical protein